MTLRRNRAQNGLRLTSGLRSLVAILFIAVVSKLPMQATVTSVSVQSPHLSTSVITSVTTPVHFEATAESDLDITGLIVYVDDERVMTTSKASLDAWVMLAPGTAHFVYVKAWDSSGALAHTAKYWIKVTGVVTPVPPPTALRSTGIDTPAAWTVDNHPDVGGSCNSGRMGEFASNLNPNTANSRHLGGDGIHLLLTSRCRYDDALFYWKKTQQYPVHATNFLWDFWFYVPTTTHNNHIQALEADLFQAVQLQDGVHEFMFGSQCNYVTNQWQLWLPKNRELTWVDTGLSPCRFSTGSWHHATYFVQRVAKNGYQELPAAPDSSDDHNTHLRFGTLTIDGNTLYLGGVSYSTIPNPRWEPVLGIQHQLDSAVEQVTIEQYIQGESVFAW